MLKKINCATKAIIVICKLKFWKFCIYFFYVFAPLSRGNSYGYPKHNSSICTFLPKPLLSKMFQLFIKMS